MKKTLFILLLLAPVLMRAQAIDTTDVAFDQLQMQAKAIEALNADLKAYANGQAIGFSVVAVGLGSVALSTMSEDPTKQRNLAILGGCLCVAGTLWCASNGSILKRHNVTLDARGLVVSIDKPKKKRN